MHGRGHQIADAGERFIVGLNDQKLKFDRFYMSAE